MARAARRRGRRSLRLRLMAGAAALVCAPAAQAQQAPASPDGLPPDAVYFEAGAISDNRETTTITAEQDVLARFEGRNLRADHVVYNTGTGVFSAQGEVELINPDGSVQYADRLELDDDL